MNLEQLRAMRKTSGNTLSKIASELQKQDSSSSNRKDDDRFWKAQVDKAGNGSAVIRFLPSIDENGLPWTKMYDHGFQGPTGKWYIEKCLTTLGQADPVVEHCNELWATGLESDKKEAQKRKRRLSYICNVLVVSDPKNPENDGQVKLFKFGKKLFDKIKDKLQPTFEDEAAVDVFNAFNGANFRLRIRKVDGYSNTDKSEFDSQTPISDDDEEILAVLNKRHALEEFTDPKNFKSYEELKRKLDTVLSGTQSAGNKKAADFLLEDDEPKVPAKPPIKEKVAVTPKAAVKTNDDEDLSFFESLIDD
jgi:hypothetical protein